MKIYQYLPMLGASIVFSVLSLDNCDGGSPLQLLAQAEETPEIVLAAQIRSQGFACDGPLSAEKDEKDSKPDEAAWVLRCQGATYKIRLIPHMAAKVELLQQPR